MPLISCSSLTMSFGGPPVVEGASFLVERGERVGLLGRNGEGKSTFLRLLAGELEPDAGEVTVSEGVRVARLVQQVPADLHQPVIEIVAGGLAGAEKAYLAEKFCSQLDVDPGSLFSELSGGQRRRALLARVLASEPDVLLLDEPTNHLDLERIEWLEGYLARTPAAVVFVTHDRAFLQKLATRIIDIDRGRLQSWACDYRTYLVRKEQQLAAEEKAWSEFDKKLAKEEAWIRQGIKARRTRNEGRVRALHRLREDRAVRRDRAGRASMAIQEALPSGEKVINAENVSFSYEKAGAPVPIVSGFTGLIARGDKVGLIGPNGCGKTTFLQILLGKIKPDTGWVKHGTALEVSYFDQHRHQLTLERSVAWNVAGENDKVIVHGRPRHVISYLEDFLFRPEQSRQPVATLSGGERNRVLLARLFTRPSNLLVLDEPTNDLDAETLEILEALLVDYEGTLLVVSHDRQFLDNVCSSTLVFEGQGRVTEYPGGYSDWQRIRQLQAAAVPEAKVKKEPAVKPQANRKGLSNKERERLANLPKVIEGMETELAELQEAMADPGFYRKNAQEVKAAVERVQALPGEIEQAYQEWTTLDGKQSK